MPHLPLETATLYYELHPSTPNPSAPTLLLIHGGNGTCNNFRALATTLSPHMTVILYDRRGFSRSPLTGPQDYTGTARIERDAADAAALITHISPHGTPAAVLGNSSGALVALELLVRHPETVSVLLAHEPPAMSVLPQRESWYRRQREVYELYRAQGPVAAMGKFIELVRARDDSSWPTGAGSAATTDVQQKDRDRAEQDPYFQGNVMYWFEREVVVTVFHEFDLGRLREEKGKLVLVNGRGTSVEAPQYLANVELGKKLGVEVTMFEGGHLAFQADPERFAEDIKGCVRGRGGVYSQ